MPFIGENVLEVGAGIGSTTLLLSGYSKTWTALEPDAELAAQIEVRDSGVEVKVGVSSDLKADDLDDSILYIDVLEHIERHSEEIFQVQNHLALGGHLILLTPAHQFLFTPFDTEIGHFRRYNRALVDSIRPKGMKVVGSWYLDSAGFFASLGNRLLLRSTSPTVGQIRLWDRKLVPISRVLDAILGYNFGKSLLTVWEKE